MARSASTKAAYIGTGVVATGINFDGHVHADSEQLLISSSSCAFVRAARWKASSTSVRGSPRSMARQCCKPTLPCTRYGPQVDWTGL